MSRVAIDAFRDWHNLVIICVWTWTTTAQLENATVWTLGIKLITHERAHALKLFIWKKTKGYVCMRTKVFLLLLYLL